MAEFNLVHFVFDRTAESVGEDTAVMTCHIRKHIAFAPDVGPITDTERDDFTAKVNTWWATVRAYVHTGVTFRELRYYDVPSTPGADMGAPKKIATISSAGTSGVNALPPQVALSVTFRTAERKRWGRFYIPCLTTSILSSTGRVPSGTCQTIANACAPLCNRGGTGANLTVFSRVHWDDQDVQKVQVDDVLDVIRRRRYSAPTVRATANP